MNTLDMINQSLTAAAHDTAGEKRDAQGQWTSGGANMDKMGRKELLAHAKANGHPGGLTNLPVGELRDRVKAHMSTRTQARQTGESAFDTSQRLANERMNRGVAGTNGHTPFAAADRGRPSARQQFADRQARADTAAREAARPRSGRQLENDRIAAENKRVMDRADAMRSPTGREAKPLTLAERDRIKASDMSAESKATALRAGPNNNADSRAAGTAGYTSLAQPRNADGKPVSLVRDHSTGIDIDTQGDYMVDHGDTGSFEVNTRPRAGHGGYESRSVLYSNGASDKQTSGVTWSENTYSQSPAHAKRVWANRAAISNAVAENTMPEKPGGLIRGGRLRVKFNDDGKTLDITKFNGGGTLASNVPRTDDPGTPSYTDNVHRHNKSRQF